MAVDVAVDVEELWLMVGVSFREESVLRRVIALEASKDLKAASTFLDTLTATDRPGCTRAQSGETFVKYRGSTVSA
ncbi:hypothetical protein [Citricoccus sp. GCM10030269]|uniref:hypothetical protein n=1 Tax=Citricoccus sp. GCM10030269 TaxID=3273388 RepID=UPI00360E688E